MRYGIIDPRSTKSRKFYDPIISQKNLCIFKIFGSTYMWVFAYTHVARSMLMQVFYQVGWHGLCYEPCSGRGASTLGMWGAYHQNSDGVHQKTEAVKG